MSDLQLFIWEGNKISEAYHDDGTLVVLAHDVDEARRIMREGRAERARQEKRWYAKRDEALASWGGALHDFWRTPQGKALSAEMTFDSQFWDGTDEALDQEPTRVLTVDEPKWVAFNGGGYD